MQLWDDLSLKKIARDIICLAGTITSFVDIDIQCSAYRWQNVEELVTGSYKQHR